MRQLAHILLFLLWYEKTKSPFSLRCAPKCLRAGQWFLLFNESSKSPPTSYVFQSPLKKWYFLAKPSKTVEVKRWFLLFIESSKRPLAPRSFRPSQQTTKSRFHCDVLQSTSGLGSGFYFLLNPVKNANPSCFSHMSNETKERFIAKCSKANQG